MLVSLAQQQPADAAAAFVGLATLFFCFIIALAIGQFAVFIVALAQILGREMPTEAKALWIAVCWFLPVIGPILWWTIGAKQYRKAQRGP
jgi:Na+-driven multidrug efflux pump